MSPRFPPVSDWARRAYSDTGLWDGRLLDGYLDEVATVTPDRLAVVDGKINGSQYVKRAPTVAIDLCDALHEQFWCISGMHRPHLREAM